MPSIFDILVFLLVLGVLVFVHELGHFLAAKACGVYVDRFSLGMPPRLFGFTYGETDYCVGLLPIGGYVKMAGQEDAPLSEEEREETYGNVPPERWFNNKKVWQRAIILVAGPAMNLVLAVVVYAFMAGYGRDVPLAEYDTRIGILEPESPATTAPLYLTLTGEAADFSKDPDAVGLKAGDRIVSINQTPMTRFQDIIIESVLGKGEEAVIEIERPAPEGHTLRYLALVTPKVLDDSGLPRFGIAPFDTALVRHVLPDSPAKELGILPKDIILTADGEIVDRSTFSVMVQALPSGSAIDLKIERDGETIESTVLTRNTGRIKDMVFTEPIDPLIGISDEVALQVKEISAELAVTTGLHPGDSIVSLDGRTDIGSAVREWTRTGHEGDIAVNIKRAPPILGRFGKRAEATLELSLIQVAQALTGTDGTTVPTIAGITEKQQEESGLKRKDVIIEIDGKPATMALLADLEENHIGETLPIKARRPSQLFGLYQKEEIVESTLTIASIQQIGVVWDTEMIFRREPLSNILPYAVSETYRQVAQIGTILAKLFTGGLSPKHLGGPVMIGDVVTMASQIGFFYVLDIMAMISVNLAVFNLLPLPILDGGQLVFLGIEAIRRRPVSVRVVETVQQVGFFMIIGLLLYVTFNDISRIFDRFLP